MGMERAARNVTLSEGVPNEAESASDEDQVEIINPRWSIARLRTAASEPEELDLDSLPELPFTD